MNKKALPLLLLASGALLLASCGTDEVTTSSSGKDETASSSQGPSISNEEKLMTNLLSMESIFGAFELQAVIPGSSALALPQTVEVYGDLAIRMETLEDLSLSFPGELHWNDSIVPFDLTYADGTAYLSAGLPNAGTDRLRISSTIDEIGDLGTLIGEALGVEMPSFGDVGGAEDILSAISLTEHPTSQYAHAFTLTIGGAEGLALELGTDEDMNLTIVEGNFLAGDASVRLSYGCELNSEDCPAISVPSDKDDYQSLGTLTPIAEDILALANEKKASFALSVDELSIDGKGSVGTGSGILLSAEGSIDRANSLMDATLSFQAEGTDSMRTVRIRSEKEKAYLNYSDSLKLSFPQEELDEFTALLMEDFPLEEGLLQDLMDIILGSEAIASLLMGDYSALLDLATGIRQGNGVIEVDLDLSSFSVGDEAAMTVTLASDRILSLDVGGLEWPYYGARLGFTLDLLPYEEISFDGTGYAEVTGLPSVYSQFSALVEGGRALIGVTADLGTPEEPETLEGKVYADGVAGSASLALDYKETFVPVSEDGTEGTPLPVEHKILADYIPGAMDGETGIMGEGVLAVDYDVLGNNTEESESHLKGAIGTNAISSMGETVTSLLGEDSRFLPLLENSLENIALLSAIKKASEGNYEPLLALDFVKEAKNTESGLSFTIVGSSIASDDFEIVVNQDENGQISSIALEDIVFTLSSFDGDLPYQTDYLEAKDSYIDLSPMGGLVDALAKDAQLDAHHLRLTLDLNIMSIVKQTITADFYIDSEDIGNPSAYADINVSHTGILDKAETTEKLALDSTGIYLEKATTKSGNTTTTRESWTIEEFSADPMTPVMSILDISSTFSSMMEFKPITDRPPYYDTAFKSFSYDEAENAYSLSLAIEPLAMMNMGGLGSFGDLDATLVVNDDGYLSKVDFSAALIVLAKETPIPGSLELLDIGNPIPAEKTEAKDALIASFFETAPAN